MARITLVALLVVGLLACAAADAPKPNTFRNKGPRRMTLRYTQGATLSAVPSGGNDALNVTGTMVYSYNVVCAEAGRNAGAIVGVCSETGILISKTSSTVARGLWNFDCTFTSECGRFGTGSIELQGVAGGMETWTVPYTFPVTGGSGYFFGASGSAVIAPTGGSFDLVLPYYY